MKCNVADQTNASVLNWKLSDILLLLSMENESQVQRSCVKDIFLIRSKDETDILCSIIFFNFQKLQQGLKKHFHWK